MSTKRTPRELDVEVEVDETFFGGMRKGKPGRGAADKVFRFVFLKRNIKVLTDVVSMRMKQN